MDLCIAPTELQAVKESLLKVVSQLPQNIHVGLLCFNRNIFLYDFEDNFTKFTCLSGNEDYGPAPYQKLKDHIGLMNVDPKFVSRIISSRHYVVLNNNNLIRITKAILSLKADNHKVPRDQR